MGCCCVAGHSCCEVTGVCDTGTLSGHCQVPYKVAQEALEWGSHGDRSHLGSGCPSLTGVWVVTPCTL